jgi:hypothetical protein
MINVQNANTKVTEIFPVKLAPPGKKGNKSEQIIEKNKKENREQEKASIFHI